MSRVRRTDIDAIDHPAVMRSQSDTQPVPGDVRHPLDRPERTGARLKPGAVDQTVRAAYALGELDPENDPDMLEFLAEEEGPLGIGIDDPDFAYKWIRHMLRGEGDGVDRHNLVAHAQGRLRWDFVRLEELPAVWRERLRIYVSDAGPHAGFVVNKDLILARAPRNKRDGYLRAQQYRAEQQRAQVRRSFDAAVRRGGSEVVYAQDQETRD